MRLLASAASAMVLAQAAPVLAAPVKQPPGPERVGEWSVSPAAGGGCLALRRFPDGARLSVVVRESGEGKLTLVEPQWTMAPAESYPVALSLDGRRQPSEWTAAGEGARRGIFTTIDARFVTDLAAARRLEVLGADGSLLDWVDLTGIAAAILRARGCASEMARHPGFAPPPPPPPPPPSLSSIANRPPRPMSSLAPGDYDYPAAALRAGEQGTVAFTLDVSPLGYVTGCTINQSSGSVVLDSTTCRLLTLRGRFHPATDAKGHPTAGSFSSRIQWRITEPPPPPPTPAAPA